MPTPQYTAYRLHVEVRRGVIEQTQFGGAQRARAEAEWVLAQQSGKRAWLIGLGAPVLSAESPRRSA